MRLTKVVGVIGLREEGAAFVLRLRLHREGIQAALEAFSPSTLNFQRSSRVMSSQEVALGALRIKGRSRRASYDLSLYYILFATGLRPLEIARLIVGDYLHVDGSVRRESEVRAEIAINGRLRPLYFSSQRQNDVMGAYIAERARHQHHLGVDGRYRGGACE